MVSQPSRRREVIPYVILAAALMVTASAARYAHVSGAREDQLRFERDAESVIAAIGNRLDAYIAMLHGGAGLFAASDDVTRDEFRAYVRRLELQRRYPAIQGIGFSRLIHDDERDAVLSAMKRDVPSFQFWPDDYGGDFNAIVYLEPDDVRNRSILGFDMASESNRAEAMRRARDSGTAVATGKLTLGQEGGSPGKHQAGFLIYVPVYRRGNVPASVDERRAALLGFVYSPFRGDDLLRGIIGMEVPSTIAFDVFDGGPVEENLIYRSPFAVANRTFQHQRRIDIAERPWTVVLYAGDSVRLSSKRTMVALIAVCGMALSSLLFAVMRGQVKARLSAERTAEELRRSEERLRVADRAKDEFLATISHELRTPLNAILGWASMLSRGAIPKEMHPHAINVITRNAAAQARLVEDLLDMSRVVGGHLRLRFADTNPAAVFGAAVESFRPTAAEAGLTILYEPPVGVGPIEADADRLQQIVANLLSNALKFTPRGGRITLQANRVGETLVITVTDTGIGMEPDFVPFVFERFRQADSSATRAHPGAGLGLAIARHLVELHAGSIEAASEGTGRGATFTVRLPVRQPARGPRLVSSSTG
jgi:signal transduction histidine kinase